jgi:hypothetical protein
MIYRFHPEHIKIQTNINIDLSKVPIVLIVREVSVFTDLYVIPLKKWDKTIFSVNERSKMNWYRKSKKSC